MKEKLMIDEVVRKIYEEDAKVKPHVRLSVNFFPKPGVFHNVT